MEQIAQVIIFILFTQINFLEQNVLHKINFLKED